MMLFCNQRFGYLVGTKVRIIHSILLCTSILSVRKLACPKYSDCWPRVNMSVSEFWLLLHGGLDRFLRHGIEHLDKMCQVLHQIWDDFTKSSQGSLDFPTQSPSLFLQCHLLFLRFAHIAHLKKICASHWISNLQHPNEYLFSFV